jgi:hypothetical protein
VNSVESNPWVLTESVATMPDSDRIALGVGGISFGVSSTSVRLAIEPDLQDFAFASTACDVEMEVGWTDRLLLPPTAPCFQSGGLWSAYEENGGFSFYFQTAHLGLAPYKKAEFDPAFKTGRISLLKECFDLELPVYPLEYPLDELLMIHRLSMGEGVEVHGCGVLTTDGAGRLFIGHSGAGKSTTSRLWLKQPGSCVLSDDRIILRRQQGQLRMYGTPWHGDAGLAAQASGKVDHIFLLEHGSRNEIIPLAKPRAVAELFARTFVPHHSAAGLAFSLQFIEQAALSVPVSLFRCVPDATAVEAILHGA